MLRFVSQFSFASRGSAYWLWGLRGKTELDERQNAVARSGDKALTQLRINLALTWLDAIC
jgi:hypothetical protein